MLKRTVLAAAAALVPLVTLLPVSSAPASAAGAAPVAARPAAPTTNDWRCRPGPTRPYPVIMLHGTFGDQRMVFDKLSSSLLGQGYCVFGLDYGDSGTAAVATSASQLKAFITRVLSATGAAKVSLVGHSQGATMPLHYIKYLGGSSKVDDLIGFAPAHHGTSRKTPLLKLAEGITCRACSDMIAGSWFLRMLAFGDESFGRVSYTNIVSTVDDVVLPYTSGFLRAASNVANIRIQDYCPSNKTHHFFVPRDPAFIRFALDALSHPGPARTSYRPRCTW